jgi:IS30 family transposase
MVMELEREYWRKPDTLKIWQLSKDGLSAREISAKLGFKFNKVNSALRRGREANELPPIFKKAISHARHHKNYLRLGSISTVLDALTNEQVEWLATQTRSLGCETVAEFIAELVRDAHANEELKNE